ncbi:MAG: hypothetical protein AAF196_06590 [Planctomycetota bacterium]
MRTLVALLSILTLTACGRSGHVSKGSGTLITPVSVEVEVFDPVTNGVWIDACIRVVEAYFEDGDVIVATGRPDLIFKTDLDGRVFLSAFDLADAEVGFFETFAGEAYLESGFFADEAIVTVEVSGAGFPTVRRDVALSFDFPDGFVAIPWEPLPVP